ncbi:MAG: dipeptidase [Candidatus Rokuibacteriota bacterium]
MSDLSREFPPVLDGHEDFLTAMPVQGRDFLTESADGHVDWPRARRGGLGGAFVSIYLDDRQAELNAVGYALGEMNDYLRICDRSGGAVRTVRTSGELDRALGEGAFAGILHFEGADPISYSLKELRVFYEAGLRSLGLVWSRPTIFGSGVRFRGPQPVGGLTEAGLALVAECNRLGILLDVSHLNPAGFWDLCRATTRPFVATHSSVKAISPHGRNLDDDQIRAIAARDGTIGINFANSFLRPDMAREDDTPLELVVAHFEHVIALVGDRHVSIGSDWDGAAVPSALKDAAQLPVLLRAFKQRGWSDDRMERICNGNFRRVLCAVWREGR